MPTGIKYKLVVHDKPPGPTLDVSSLYFTYVCVTPNIVRLVFLLLNHHGTATAHALKEVPNPAKGESTGFVYPTVTYIYPPLANTNTYHNNFSLRALCSGWIPCKQTEKTEVSTSTLIPAPPPPLFSSPPLPPPPPPESVWFSWRLGQEP